jgi:hypothetical protein
MDLLLDAKEKHSLPIAKSASCTALSSLSQITKKRAPELQWQAKGMKNSVSSSARKPAPLVPFQVFTHPELDQHDLLESVKKSLQLKKFDVGKFFTG